MTNRTLILGSTIALFLGAFNTKAQTILFEDFNNCAVPAGWDSSTLGQGWELGTTSALSGGSLNIPSKGSCVAVINDSETVGNNAYYDYLVTPMIDITGMTAINFEFDVYIPVTGCYLNIEYSKDSSNWSNAWSGGYEMATSGWDKVEFTAGQQFFTGGTDRWIRLAYKDYNVNTAGVAVDDFHMYIPENNDLKLVSVGRNEWSLLNDPQNIEGRVFNNGLNDVTTYDINWQIDGGTVSTEQITPLYPYPTYSSGFDQADAFELTTAGAHELKIWVSNPNGMTDSNPDNDTITMITSGADWLPTKRVLLEKFTHTECSPCVAGDDHMNIMLDDHSFATGVSIHAAGSDPYTIPDGYELDSAYIIAHPAFMVDRKLLYTNVGWFGYDIDSYLGETEDIDFAGTDIQAAEVHIEKVSYDSGSKELQFDVVATFYGDYTSEMGLNAYIIEDSVIGYQVAAPDPNNYAHNHMLREMMGGTWGNNFNMTDVNTSDNTYRETFNYVLDSGFDEDNISFVGIVQKQNSSVHSRDIINCTPAYHIEEGIALSTEDMNRSELEIYPNPTTDMFYVIIPQGSTSQAQITIRDVSGKTIAIQNVFNEQMTQIDVSSYDKGIYLIELRDQNNQTFNQKVIVK